MIVSTWEEWRDRVVNIAGFAWNDLIGQRFMGVLDLSAAKSVVMPTGASALTFPTGTWTPAITFATPGDLAVTYSLQQADYIKQGRLVTARFTVVTSAFTWTTAAGQLRITGLPFAAGVGPSSRGTLAWGGITKAGYTQMITATQNTINYLIVSGSGSGVASATIVAADLPTGGNVVLAGSISYLTDT